MSRAASDGNGNAKWHCVCDCGAKTISYGFNLRDGASKSCGCLTTEQLKDRATKHNLWGIPEYWSWAHMIQRCENKKGKGYARYGGRGISVCKRWRESFEAFYQDMGPKPTPDHSIDRINNDKGYEPDNCRWATVKQQNNNTSACHWIVYKGKRMSLTDAVALTGSGISRGGVFSRLRRGWSIEDALDVPVDESVWANRSRGRRNKVVKK